MCLWSNERPHNSQSLKLGDKRGHFKNADPFHFALYLVQELCQHLAREGKLLILKSLNVTFSSFLVLCSELH